MLVSHEFYLIDSGTYWLLNYKNHVVVVFQEMVGLQIFYEKHKAKKKKVLDSQAIFWRKKT